MAAMMITHQLAVVAALLLLLFPNSGVLANEYIVGDSNGWTINLNYTQWAADKTFYVGDTLVFNYDNALHNVFRITTAEAFKNCEKPDPKHALTTGRDVIELASPGKKWYICGVADHCAQFNQKLAITVFPINIPLPSLPWIPGWLLLLSCFN